VRALAIREMEAAYRWIRGWPSGGWWMALGQVMSHVVSRGGSRTVLPDLRF